MQYREKNGRAGEVTEKIIEALGTTVNTTVASVDTSKIVGEAKKQFALAKSGIEELSRLLRR
ncbi:MAG: hypothetical protein HY695_19780 [Deltaproteobacteria bacterium]|nr:hypothetical protein [Deltaproteobacteria bacterium]